MRLYRAIILGLLLGLAVSAATYFNDYQIRQTMLIGNHFPISIFGAAVILLLVVNPLLRLLGPGWTLRGGEIAIIVAVALAACGWPGSGFFRGYDTIVGLPAHWMKTKPGWQSQELMSYVPGGSPRLAPGHVQDWPETVRWLASGEGEAGGASEAGPVWSRLSEATRSMVRRSAAGLESSRALEGADEGRLLRAINAELIEPIGDGALWRLASDEPGVAAALADADAMRARAPPDATADSPEMAGFYVREAEHAVRHANRAALVSLAPEGALLPAPSGEGVLVASGRADPYVVDTLLQGRETDPLGVAELPWGAWWPTLRLWWTLALLLGFAALCLTLIVHPQWSRRELLAYPVARFVEEVSERQEGKTLPVVARSPMFWGALVAIMAVHSLNGLHAWYPTLPHISMELDLQGLKALFPTGSRVPVTDRLWMPRVYPSVVAFSFFLTTVVSFSLGISTLAFMLLGTLMLSSGMAVEVRLEDSNRLNLLRFGAYVGMFLIILYTGRRYYVRVAAGMVGLPRGEETPGYAIWAGRGLALTLLGSVLVLKTSGLGWGASAALVALAILIMVVMTRIVVETGAFFMQPHWMPSGVLAGLFGFDYLGPTSFIVLSIASLLMVGDPRETLMPYLANALRVADRAGNTPPTRIAPWMGVMILAGFLVAGTTTLYVQYRFGLSRVAEWTKTTLPTMSFNQLEQFAAEAAATGTLASATAGEGAFAPVEGVYPWALAGLVLVVATAAARMRLAWWPIHPVLFLVWGTYPINHFAFSFLLGWLMKSVVVRTMGVKGYHTIKPMVIGVIAGELLAGLLWTGIGMTYFFWTGTQPVVYPVFPQ